MNAKIWVTCILLLLLNGCATNPRCFKNYCQKDYWGDSQFEIFGRKNCIGRTGNWVSLDNGHDGYYCTTPNCTAPSRIRCTDTCTYY